MSQLSTFKVYNASAGSGKTFALVKEYLKLLLETSDVNRFQHILAITFTNKAAAEMKTRVIYNLRDFSKIDILSDKTEMFNQIERETALADTLLHKRSNSILQRILNNYSAFNITTIDSFTHRLIRSFSFDLGLSLNFEVEMDAKSLLNEAVDLIISKIGEDKELTNILTDYALEKIDEDKSWDISYDLKEIAVLLLNESDILEIQKIKEKSLSDFIDLKKNLNNKQIGLKKTFAELGSEGLRLIESFELEHSDFYYQQFPKFFLNLINEVDKINFDSTKGLAKSIENSLYYTKNKPEEVKTSIDSIINPLLELYQKSKHLYEEFLLNKLIINSLIPLAVLNKINEVLDTLKEEKNVRLNAEFNQVISKNLREQPAAFIYERIGEKLKHYFIDEMQDTSELQWQNLIPLIDNALSQENASLMLVGDAKQAIYRWRGGEANQFIELSNKENSTIQNNPFQLEKKVSFLETNYRSFSEIIHFNNALFQYISSYFQNPVYSAIYKKGNVQTTTKRIGGYVQLSFIEEGSSAKEKDDIYPEKVFQIITDLTNDFDKNEICVLTRTRKQGIAVANYLSEKEIEIISSETLLLKNSIKVNFLVDLMTYLQQKNDKESKIEILYFLYKHLNIAGDAHDFISDFIDTSIIDFCKQLQKYNIHFDYSNYVKLPFYESIEELIRCFQLTKSSDAYLQFFLDEILKFSQQKSEGVLSFLEFWEEKKETLSIVVPEEKDAVKIMTIHKAKGLEFPVVIFPYDLDIYKEQRPKIWFPIQDKSTYNNFDSILVNLNKSLEQTGDLGTKIYQERRDKLELDNINLLYVTLTRAIEQLYIVSETKKEADQPRSYAQFFLGFLKSKGVYNVEQSVYEFGSKERISPRKKNATNSYELEEFISSSWQERNITIATNATHYEIDTKNTSIAYGNLVHEVLSKIKVPTDIDYQITQFLLAGIIPKKDVESIEELVHKVVHHPRLQPYFEQNNTVINEREILTSNHEIIIPDRLVINDKKEAIIIDYKTGKIDKKHHHQLNSYANAISDLGYTVKEKLLVYIGDTIQIKEV